MFMLQLNKNQPWHAPDWREVDEKTEKGKPEMIQTSGLLGNLRFLN